MRSIKRFFTGLIRKPPLLFPWVALFHILMLAYIVWLYRDMPLFSVAWLQPLWMLCYTVCWIFVCDLRKWAAYGYLALTSLNLALNYLLRADPAAQDLYVSALLLIDVGFSFILLFFFRRFV